MRVLCVCLGNICRSPMAEGAIRVKAAEAGVPVEVDSAGTGAWHVGDPPDARALKVAASRGYDNSAQRARQVEDEDFTRFHLIVAMDHKNLQELVRVRPMGAPAELRLFHPAGTAIPDPYGREDAVYHRALDLVEEATEHLIAQLRDAQR